MAKNKKVLIMGILNVTPDSFSDGGSFFNIENALKRAAQIIEEGGSIIDIGGESTRPNADFVSSEEEIERVIPIIKEIRKTFPKAIISIDTYKGKVAMKAMESGANIINDVWGGLFDELNKTGEPSTLDIAKQFGCEIILMHNRKDLLPDENFIENVFNELKLLKNNAINKRIPEEKIILDVGIGFAKTPAQNLELIKNHKTFKELGCKMLLGVSRKSTLKNIVGDNLDVLDSATAIFNMHAVINKSADIIRVHNVAKNKMMLNSLFSIEQGLKWTK